VLLTAPAATTRTPSTVARGGDLIQIDLRRQVLSELMQTGGRTRRIAMLAVAGINVLMSRSPGPGDLPSAFSVWSGQIERLPEHASPCRNLPDAKWAAMRANVLAFIDQFGAEAHRLGWTAEQLFGVHPELGTLLVEHAGALMIHDRPAIAVEAERIVFDGFSFYRTKPGQTWGVPVWEFAARC
jgi:hypothetical protein